MGGWVCVKALQQLPNNERVCVVSLGYSQYIKEYYMKKKLPELTNDPDKSTKYFVLNITLREIFDPLKFFGSPTNKTAHNKSIAASGLTQRSICSSFSVSFGSVNNLQFLKFLLKATIHLHITNSNRNFRTRETSQALIKNPKVNALISLRCF